MMAESVKDSVENWLTLHMRPIPYHLEPPQVTGIYFNAIDSSQNLFISTRTLPTVKLDSQPTHLLSASAKIVIKTKY
jgi:hypothetical protein